MLGPAEEDSQEGRKGGQWGPWRHAGTGRTDASSEGVRSSTQSRSWAWHARSAAPSPPHNFFRAMRVAPGSSRGRCL